MLHWLEQRIRRDETAVINASELRVVSCQELDSAQSATMPCQFYTVSFLTYGSAISHLQAYPCAEVYSVSLGPDVPVVHG